MTIKCPKCQSGNPDTQKFCGECATPLQPFKEIPVTETLETPLKELRRGTTFAGRYEFIEELGRGGMGRIYKVFDKKIKEEVAVKILKPEIASDETTVERFSNELRLARKIVHKNVGRMYELMEDEGTHYITMEYVPGEDLKSLIRRIGQLPVGKSISIAKQVCEGLSEAHKLGVVHRDLKPGNIMIDKEGNARIMDFGIARSLKREGITTKGVVVGTPEYMSSEQVDGKEADHRSDIYSLGIVLYEMLTGKVPFEGDTSFSIALKHKTEKPKDPRELNEGIPDYLSRLILKCLEKKRENRYQSAAEIIKELEPVKIEEKEEKEIKERGKLYKLLFTPIIKTKKKRRINYKKIFSKSLKYGLRALIVLSIIYVIISVIGLVNDAIYKEKLKQIKVERDTYYRTLFPIRKDWLPEEWGFRDCNAFNSYRKAFPSTVDPNGTYVVSGEARREMKKVYNDYNYDIKRLRTVVDTYNKDFKFDELFTGVRCSKLDSSEYIKNVFILNAINMIQTTKMIVLNSRLDFLDNNYEKGFKRLHDSLIYVVDIMMCSGSLIESLIATICFKMIYIELIPAILAKDANYNNKAISQLERIISTASEKFDPDLVYYREYLLLGTIPGYLISEDFGWGKDYHLYGKLLFWRNGFSIMRSTYKASEFYKGLFEGLKYIQNIRNKGIYINDYMNENLDRKNIAYIVIANLTTAHFKFSLTRTFGKLALVLLYMNKYGMNSIEFSDLKGTDNFINEISGKKFEIISEGMESFIVLNEKYKLNLKKIDYQKEHKEILKSFEYFDITSMAQLRSIFYSFELE